MRKLIFATSIFCAFVCQCVLLVQAQDSNVPYSDCADLARTWIVNLTAAPPFTPLTPQEVSNSFLHPSKHLTCFASAMPSISRTSVLKALAESLSNSKQQSSPAGSSGSTSSVSKPAGSTSLIQDVGGVSVTKNGSSLTLQLAPGDLGEKLGSDGVFDFCTSTIQKKALVKDGTKPKTEKCVSPGLLKILVPATFSVTANTTTPGSAVSGMATTTGTTVPVTLNSASDTLSFGAFTAKYAFLYPKKDADAVANDLMPAAQALAKSLVTFTVKIEDCQAYKDWSKAIEPIAIKAFSEKDQAALEAFMLRSYAQLGAALAKDSSCNLGSSIEDTLNTVSAYQTAIAAEKVIAKSATPLFGLEYDFTTPPSKPSYHSAKLNFSWHSSAGCSTQVKAAAASALKVVNPKATLDKGIAATCSVAPADSKKASLTSTSATPSWTVGASGGADIYNDEPSSAIPSASHLRDVEAGAEITRVWHMSTYEHKNAALAALFSKLGDLNLVWAYYYQDQTSPSILNGPPSTITFNGLPTTASQVFATRGPINVGQIRLGFGTGTNLRFPIAVSYSNRSDLIVHPFVGVQFGVSYDLFGK